MKAPGQRDQRIERLGIELDVLLAGAGLRQDEEREAEVEAVQHGRGDERGADPDVAQNAAEHRPDDEADAEHGMEQAEALGALLFGGDVGDVGRGDGHVGAGETGDRPTDDEHPELGREGHEEIVDGGARQRDQQHRPAAEAVAHDPEHRRKDKLHRRIERVHDADLGSDVGDVGHVGQQPRQDREDEPDAHSIERHGGEDDDERAIHSRPRAKGCVSYSLARRLTNAKR